MVDKTATLNNLIGALIKKYNTLLDCPIRFSGQYGGQTVQHFIDYVEIYKKIKCISDSQALHEFGHLLTDTAHSWWLRRRCRLSTWSEAKSALQKQYSEQREVHLIYKDIFWHSYNEYKSDEDFINDKYELFDELPDPKPSEKCKLDMVFALLPIERQSKVDYTKISNILELKEQLKTMENVSKHNGAVLTELQRSIELKETLNGIIRIVPDNQDHRSAETPTEVHIVNDKDPIIKVRRTEDLMPQVKQEEREQNTHYEQDEFISIENEVNNTSENLNNFQIDTDIMNQINNIIDESEMHCDTVADNLQISSVMSASDSHPSTIAFLINGQTGLQNANNTKSNNEIKKKMRCSFCRKYGHFAPVCLKRMKQNNILPEKFDTTGKYIKSNSQKDADLLVTSSNNSNSNTSDEINITSHIPDTTITSLGNNVPSQEATNSLLTSQPCGITSTAPTVFSLNTSLPSVPPPFSHISTLSTVSPTISHVTALTTKLIAPINGPGPNKQLAAKLRSINGPTPKCHQCGNVGFYKSICPNCSPIYNSNQYKP